MKLVIVLTKNQIIRMTNDDKAENWMTIEIIEMTIEII